MLGRLKNFYNYREIFKKIQVNIDTFELLPTWEHWYIIVFHVFHLPATENHFYTQIHSSRAVFFVDDVIVYFLSLFTFRYHFLLFSCCWRPPDPTFTLPYPLPSLLWPYILPYLTFFFFLFFFLWEIERCSNLWNLCKLSCKSIFKMPENSL